MVGRPRKPLSQSTRKISKKERKEREMAESMVKGKSDNIKAPTWLKDKVAKKEFKRLADELAEIDLICNLDVNHLAGYCEAYGKYVKATLELDGKSLTIPKLLPNGSYSEVPHPLLKIQKMYAEECRKFASLIGLTMDSRLKISPKKLEQINDEVEEDFGGI
ncbi:phage terminase small subunit P27 family [Turicibacter sanguinis]|uniref:phage terminase small subunit P27 family n=1 Tax=Turicibacter sanguinis TaxID=154288 RepID=UPI0012BD1935|nr:phage terminase small subunit P27 family [Turicibacter sanguinis]MDB8575593.1 phage terminase small subunit P27 family [Turicibacter sanguinis]MDB8578771.1 phage terminase small subunit P27 family [Turicibacter sanguinis]MDB8584094.1 phage terminase small subunit P27 family [Turicibacter sanguinis]MDB8587993.1 phage terminase small subunit P27 family [Turicibacter sanguinis]MDB8598161.1 phage terminase small subunit P27 family [Turicibacter sanguinis]